ncbi:GNAT family N-acetyltransferase [Sphingobacterium lactis]|uniref:GNAT family N-acetyltransferase n=1 Tax=Sphingobacterium lactis TaxID=797291 RepID=UPI003EC787B6
MDIQLRTEKPQDFPEIRELLIEAFADEIHSDHSEQDLVERLRSSLGYVPELALVAFADTELVGYILLTKITIQGAEAEYDALALAPVAVRPKFQNLGIGGQLIEEAHRRATELGFKAIVLLGHAQYYPRFGYQQASAFGIRLPFDVPDENAMVKELVPGALHGVAGEVIYPKEFFG